MGEIISQRMGSPAVWTASPAPNVGVGVEKEASIVDIVKDENPVPMLTIAQPVAHELEYIRLGIPSPKDFKCLRNIPIALLKPSRVARVDPENPRLGRLLSDSVRVFDGKLRLSV